MAKASNFNLQAKIGVGLPPKSPRNGLLPWRIWAAKSLSVVVSLKNRHTARHGRFTSLVLPFLDRARKTRHRRQIWRRRGGLLSREQCAAISAGEAALLFPQKYENGGVGEGRNFGLFLTAVALNFLRCARFRHVIFLLFPHRNLQE